MTDTALKLFMDNVRTGWGPLSTEVVAACRDHLQTLLKAPATEDWLAALYRDLPDGVELGRDPVHGFILQAHTEPTGLYRVPHDHGRAWVIYAVLQGEVEMGTYARHTETDGAVRLVQRNLNRLCAGDVRVYLPGDIHDTRCVSGPALLLRFTERDLKTEDLIERRMTRYVERDGMWTVGPSSGPPAAQLSKR